MSSEAAANQLFQESLERATQAENFYPSFYQRFMSDSPDTQELFKGRDMERIQKKLRMTLQMVTDTSNGLPGLDMYMGLLGRIHTRLNISQLQFVQWRRALIETAEECDPEFTPETRQAWETSIDKVIAKMQAE